MSLPIKRGTCSACGVENIPYANNTKKLCSKCNEQRLSKNKPKKQTKSLKSKGFSLKSKRKKATGELAVFKEIWEERDHVCEHCGIPISEPSPSNFAHIKAKSIRPDLRLDKTNIALYCRTCHDAYDCRGTEAFNKRKNLYSNER